MTDGRILDEQIDGLTHVYRISLDGARITNAVDIELQELGPRTQVPGFRKGRAPLSMLRNYHGNRVRNAVVDRMAIKIARTLIETRNLEPVRRPTIRIEEEMAPAAGAVELSLLLEVAPRVELGPLEKFPLRRLRVPGDDPELAAHAETHLRRQLLDTLTECYDFPIPGDMVEEEYALIAAGYEAEVGEAITPQVEVELRSIAARRIRLAILFMEIGRAHDIQVSHAEVTALIERQAERDPAHQAEIIDYYLDHPTALAELRSPLFEDRVVEFLLARSDIEVVELNADDLLSSLGLK